MIERLPTAEIALSVHLRVPELVTLAKFLHPRVPTTKSDLVRLLVRELEPDRLPALWARLDDRERATLSEAVHDPDGVIHASLFAAKYGHTPRLGGLMTLFFPGADYIPADLRARLASIAPKPAPAALATVESLPDRVPIEFSKSSTAKLLVRTTANEAIHDLGTVLQLAAAGDIVVSETTSRPTDASCDRIASVLLGGDLLPGEHIRSFAWPLILKAAKLATRGPGNRLQPTPAGRKALDDPPRALDLAWNAWMETGLLDEFIRVEFIRGKGGRHGRPSDPAARREAIAEGLTDCPPDRWIDIDEFFRFLRASGRDFSVADPWRLYIGDPHYGSFGYDGPPWSLIQGRFAMAFLMEFAATLGVIDIAFIPPKGARSDFGDRWGTDELFCLSRYDGLKFIRVNPLGAWISGRSDSFAPSPAPLPAFRLADDGQLATDADPDPAATMLIDQYAERTSPRTWRLDPQRTLAAVEAGHPIAKLRAFLEQRVGAPLAPALADFLHEGELRSTALADAGPARLIECADAALADRLATERSTRAHCIPAGERLLVVPRKSLAAFRKGARGLGFAVPPEA